MNFWVVGIDHELQLARAENDSKKRRALKEQLDAMLRIGVPECEIDFIAEESKEGMLTLAKEIADAGCPTIPLINIWMTDAERDAAGIADAMKKRPGHPDHETMTYWIESRIPEDAIREEYFIRRTLDESNGAKNILMLLGDLHVDAVCEKLRGICDEMPPTLHCSPIHGMEALQMVFIYRYGNSPAAEKIVSEIADSLRYTYLAKTG
jgi:hypothetical protein